MDQAWTRFQEVVTARHCKRAFLDRPVRRETLERVLAAAAHAPSTRNGQPWRVSVVMGAARDALAGRLLREFDRGAPTRPDYSNRPVVADSVAEDRARAAGAGLFQSLGIARDDEVARREHLRGNLNFHGAPVAMIFHLPPRAVPGAFLELGFFVQNVMLGLVASGLGSCPQFSVAGYPDILRDELELGDRVVVCSLAVGHPDPLAPVNGFAPDRAALADYTRWHDQPPVPAAAAVTVDGRAATNSQSLERTT